MTNVAQRTRRRKRDSAPECAVVSAAGASGGVSGAGSGSGVGSDSGVLSRLSRGCGAKEFTKLGNAGRALRRVGVWGSGAAARRCRAMSSGDSCDDGGDDLYCDLVGVSWVSARRFRESHMLRARIVDGHAELRVSCSMRCQHARTRNAEAVSSFSNCRWLSWCTFSRRFL